MIETNLRRLLLIYWFTSWVHLKTIFFLAKTVIFEVFAIDMHKYKEFYWKITFKFSIFWILKHNFTLVKASQLYTGKSFTTLHW